MVNGHDEITGCRKNGYRHIFSARSLWSYSRQVYAPDGMNVNQFMVRAGAAWVYEQYNTDPVLPVLQNEARQQKRGLWSDADPVPPGYGDTVNKAMAILSFICSQRE